MNWRRMSKIIAWLDLVVSGILGLVGAFTALIFVIADLYGCITGDTKIVVDERSKNFMIIIWMLSVYLVIHYWIALQLIMATYERDAAKALNMSKHWQRLNWILLVIGFLFIPSHILVRVGFLVRALLAYVVWRFDCDLENGN